MKLYKFTFPHTVVYVVAPNERVARSLAVKDARWTGETEVKGMELISDKVVVAK